MERLNLLTFYLWTTITPNTVQVIYIHITNQKFKIFVKELTILNIYWFAWFEFVYSVCFGLSLCVC